MRFRFLHLADAHLGFRQYNAAERADDFARAFMFVMREAVRHRVDFVLLAGDLFHKRSIDALTLNVAFSGLELLRKEGIPCIAIEGNHELAYYDESVGWLHFLGMRDLLIMLRPDFHGSVLELSPYAKRQGTYFDVLPGVRVHGMRYMGAGTATALDTYADALARLPDAGIEYSIFVAHTGVEGVLSGDVGSPSLTRWNVMRPHADYVALGHIHKPFEFDRWIYNPGSLESCSVDEAEWSDRGYLLVDVDTDRPKGERHTTTQVRVPRRPIVRLAVKVDLITSQEELCDTCAGLAARRVADLGVGTFDDKGPIVDLLLGGVLGFDSHLLQVREIEERVTTATHALRVLIRNSTLTRGLTAVSGDGLTRAELEEQVMANLFTSDRKYRDRSALWAKAARALKARALENTPPGALLDELAALIESVNSASAADTDPAAAADSLPGAGPASQGPA